MKKRIDCIRAFTLIELLISITIFATIAVVLYSCFRVGVVSWRRIGSELAFQQKIRSSLGSINKDFKNMLYMSNIPFEGSAEKISFVTSAAVSDDADINIAKVSYYQVPGNKEGSSKFTLIKTVESLKDAVSSEPEGREGVLQEIKLLDTISELKFSYLVIGQEGLQDEETEYEWVDFWEVEKGLPVGMKIEFIVTNPEDDRKVKLSRRIWAPAAESSQQILAGVTLISDDNDE